MIYCYSLFDEGRDQNGGGHRTAQIRDLLREAGLEWSELKESGGMNLLAKLAGLWMLRSVIGVRLPFRRRLGRQGAGYRAFRGRMGAPRHGSSVLLWESRDGAGMGAFGASLQREVPIIALPHNIESLVDDDRHNSFCEKGPARIGEEISQLAACKAVFTISWEESWLLKNSGCRALWLPYYPPKALLAELNRLRDKRASTGEFNLLFGSAENPPTLEGMREFLECYGRLRKPRQRPLIVAGHGTECLKPLAEGRDVRILGAVAPAQLDDLLMRSGCLIVHQARGAGALTRIVEALTAGIPTVVNPMAGRSVAHYEGVHTWRRAEELESLLERDLPIPPPLPRPGQQEAEFIATVLNLVGQAQVT